MNRLLYKILLANTLIVGVSGMALGQDAATFSQFLQNPFQFNPSYAAHQGHAEANIFYRKQWLGIENAPEVGAFNIQAPVGRNVSLGFTVVSNKTILLNTNSALATFGYRVRLGYYHHLNFGVSGGIALNNFDLDAVANTNDPVLMNVVQKSKYFTGQFGVNYQFKNFNIGFALPNLLDSKPNSLNDFQDVEFKPFNNKFGSISYNFNVSDIQLSPTVIYRALDNGQDQWEGMLLATYRGFLWVGASYRDGYGITGLIGVRLKNNYKVGYAYEHPTSSISQASSGSHEIYLGARFGKRNREEEYILGKQTKDSLAQVAASQKEVDSQETQVVEEKAIEKSIVIEEPKVIVAAPVVAAVTETKEESAKNEESIAKEPVEEPASYYVVLGAYRNQQNALNQMRELQEKSLLPQMLYNVEKSYYYIYLYKTDNQKDAVEELSKEREKNRFQGVWIHKVLPK